MASTAPEIDATTHEKHTYAPHTMSKDDILTTRLDSLVNFFRKWGVNWCRKNSLWPLPFATACCGIEVMATGASRYDIARFGAEAMRFSPRQADLLIVAGRVGIKTMPVRTLTRRLIARSM